jgi:Platelet-activating factor acetylhydrolase, isoform II
VTAKAQVRLPSSRSRRCLMPTRSSSQIPSPPTAKRSRRRVDSDQERARRRPVLRLRRLAALAVLVAVGGGVVVLILIAGLRSTSPAQSSHRRTTASRGEQASRPPAGPRARSAEPFATGLIGLRFVDHTRSIQLPTGQTVPRTLETYVRYPALGPPSGRDLPHARAARAQGPLPLIVFGHGFAVTPTLYASLLGAWAAVGYVVAAPVFPLANANAPGCPNESDLPSARTSSSIGPA